MEKITSTSNRLVQHLRTLMRSPEYRKEQGEFLAEGFRTVKDIPKYAVKALYVTEDGLRRYTEACAWDYPLTIFSDAVMASVSDTVTPSGIMALCKIPQAVSAPLTRAVIADGLGDPGNMGTIIRTCAACGTEDLILYGACADPFSPKVVRASMGGIFAIRIHYWEEIPDAHPPILVLDMAGENLFRAENVPKAYLLAVGSEAHGVSAQLRAASARVLSLPMTQNMESLNAGVSLSVALYQLTFGGNE